MERLKIQYIKPDKLIPYENNPRHNDSAVEPVAASIREFGFKVPIIIDANNVVVTGHTRLKAAKMLGLETVPCIRADDLGEDQINAFRLADNKVAEIATWDFDKLDIELGKIELDMGEFGFDVEGLDDFSGREESYNTDEDDEGWYGDERERTNKAYNLDLIVPENLTDDFWQMPIIRNQGYIPSELIGFNYAKTSERKDVGIHFYLDDYQFERVWNDPAKYLEILSEYDCVLSPDFSLYMDMTMAHKIWNVYRSRQIGSYWQDHGITVIPTISWAEKETFEFCFRGIPEGSIVSVSTIGVKENPTALQIWRDGMDAMIEKIKPSVILIYGGQLDYDYGDIKTVYFDNAVLERWKS